MDNIKLISKKEFQNGFTFDILEEVNKLKNVQKITFNKEISNKAKQSLDKILNSNRPSSHIQFYKDVSYTLYLCNFMKGMYINFDNVYQYITSEKYPLMEIMILRELSFYKQGYNNQ